MITEMATYLSSWNEKQVAKRTATFHNLVKMDQANPRNWAKLQATVKIAQDELARAEKAIAEDLGALASLRESESAALNVMYEIANRLNVSVVLKNEAIMESSFRNMLARNQQRGEQLALYRMAQGLLDKQRAGTEKLASQIVLHLGDVVRSVHDISFAELGPGQMERHSIVTNLANKATKYGPKLLAKGAKILKMGKWVASYAVDEPSELAAFKALNYLDIEHHDEVFKQENVGSLRFLITPLQLLETMMYRIFASSLAYTAFDAGSLPPKEKYRPGQIRKLHYKTVQEAYKTRVTPELREFVEAQPFQIIQAQEGGGSAIILYAEDRYDEVFYLGHLIGRPLRRIADKRTRTMVVGFRGTSDIATLMTDLKAKGTHYQPGTNREKYLFGTKNNSTSLE